MHGCATATASSTGWRGSAHADDRRAVNGHALGGGLELAAACDIRVAEAHVKIGLPETSLGMVPGWSGTQRLVRRFGAQMVRRMVLGGESFLRPGGAGAWAWSTRLVETGKALAEAKAWAEQIAERGPAGDWKLPNS